MYVSSIMSCINFMRLCSSKKVKAVLLWRTFGRVHYGVAGGALFPALPQYLCPSFLGVAAPLYYQHHPLSNAAKTSCAYLPVCISIARKMANFDAKYMCRGFVGLCSYGSVVYICTHSTGYNDYADKTVCQCLTFSQPD